MQDNQEQIKNQPTEHIEIAHQCWRTLENAAAYLDNTISEIIPTTIPEAKPVFQIIDGGGEQVAAITGQLSVVENEITTVQVETPIETPNSPQITAALEAVKQAREAA